MLIVHVSDLHLDYKRYGKTNPVTGVNTAWESSHECWMFACRWAVEHEADAFICGGDSFANGRPAPEAVEMVAEGFKLLSSAQIPVIVVRGNHELISIPSRHRTVNVRFEDIPGVIHVDQPKIVRLESGLSVVAVPWPKRHEVLKGYDTDDLTPTEINHLVGQISTEAVENFAGEIGSGEPTVFAGHFTVSGATLGSDRRGSEILVHAVFEEPVVSLESITEGPWAHVALGHIHKRQQLAEKVFYVGSPNRVDFSEEDDPKGFHAIYIDESNPTAENAVVDFVETPARKMRTFKQESGIPEDLEENTLVKLVLPEGKRAPDPIILKNLKKMGCEVVRVETIPTVRKKTSDETLVVDVSELEGLRAWMKKEGVHEKSHPELIALAQQILDETELTK